MKSYSLNLSKAEKFLLNLLPEAGKILNYYFKLDKLSRRQKGKHDFVTEADLAVDEFIIKRLKKEFPDILILTEETSVGNFEKYKDSELVWLVDPLDGTTNFSRKIPHFAISLALVFHSKPIIGVIYNPMVNNLFWAREDKEGAYCNGKKISASKIVDLDEAVVCTDWSHNIKTRKKSLETIHKLLGKVRSIKIMGSATSDLVNLASGKIEVYTHVYCMPWDTAAATLIGEKAGAKITDIDGGAWDVFTPGILVANPYLHSKILKLLS